MKIVTTTIARKNIRQIIDRVKYAGEVFISNSLDFLKDEPEIYTLSDIKKSF